jgi:hypothetical protein
MSLCLWTSGCLRQQSYEVMETTIRREFPGSLFPMYFPTGHHNYYYTGNITTLVPHFRGDPPGCLARAENCHKCYKFAAAAPRFFFP